MEREAANMLEHYPSINKDLTYYKSIEDKKIELENITQDIKDTSTYVECQILLLLEKFQQEGFIIKNEESCMELTTKAKYAANLREVPCMVFAEILSDNQLSSLNEIELVSLFSCFTQINVKEEYRTLTLKTGSDVFKSCVKHAEELIDDYEDFEIRNRINTGTEYKIIFDLIEYMTQWCNASNVEECKQVIQDLEAEKEIFVGELVKAIIKINNIAQEIERAAEFVGNIPLVEKVKKIPQMTLKYIATNQSLYL